MAVLSAARRAIQPHGIRPPVGLDRFILGVGGAAHPTLRAATGRAAGTVTALGTLDEVPDIGLAIR